jgi:hypothetical protein
MSLPHIDFCVTVGPTRMGFRSKTSDSVLAAESSMSAEPQLRGAELAIAHAGDRRGEYLHDFVRLSQSRAVFGLLEVADGGKRRLIVEAAQTTFRAWASELFAGEDVNEADAMIELCLQLNRSVIDVAGGISSCPAFAGCYNEDLGTICYFNAGHTSGLVRDSTGVSELSPTGLPLGLFSHVTCDARMFALQPGAALALISGKIGFEAKGKKNASGLSAVQESLQQARAESAEELCQALLNSIQLKPERNGANFAALVLLRNH